MKQVSIIQVLEQSTVGDKWVCHELKITLSHESDGFYKITKDGKEKLGLSDEILKACFDKVTPTFDFGDWIYDPMYSPELDQRVYRLYNQTALKNLNAGINPTGIRHATEDEIKAAEERLAWSVLNRQPNEFKVGDIVEFKTYIYYVNTVNKDNFPATLRASVVNGLEYTVVDGEKVKLLFPVEHRFKLAEIEENEALSTI